MRDNLFLINFAILSSGTVILLFGTIATLFIRILNRVDRMFFLSLFVTLGISTGSELICLISKSTFLSQTTLFISSLFTSVVVLPLTLYMLRCAGKPWKRNPFLYTIIVIWIVYFVLLIVTQFTRFIYYYTPDNAYHRGPWYPLLLLPPVLFMVVDIIAFCKYRSALTHRQKVSFLAYFLIPLVCMIIQMFFYGVLLIAFGTAIVVLFMFVSFMLDQSELSVRQAEENARQQASINVLQMRPHFICNTMMSIYYLIPKDAEKAQQVTLDFTTYLRNNFTAIAKPDTIPFEEELEHARAFLAVEMVRHENQLSVDFDTEYRDFRLPPLTLQPIVENAVVHGISPDLEALHITIKTEKTAFGTDLTIKDNGIGFESISDDAPHTALENITKRLKRQCNGTLTITSSPDGTTVKINIPDSE